MNSAAAELPDGRQRGPSGLNLASARCLQQPQTVADPLLRLLITLPLVIEFQARPLIRIHRLELGHPELAVGGWLRCEQRRVGPVNSKVRVSLGRRGSLVGVGFDFVLSRILSATGKCHRQRYDREGQKLCSKRGPCAQTSGVRLHATRCTVTGGRSTRDRHAHVSQIQNEASWPRLWCSAHRHANFAQQQAPGPMAERGRSWMKNSNFILTITMNQM
jgi:hypothetical protein